MFQAYAANTGNNHAAKLRNAAIISLLLNPTPPNVRPADVLQIQTEDLTVDHLGDPVTKIISYKARGVSVPLNENARGHLTAYMTDPSGYQALKSASCNYIWPARGPRGGDPVKAGNQGPMHRHSLYELTRDIGALCGIRGRVGADILRKSAT